MNLTLSQRLSLVFSVLLLACCAVSAVLQVRVYIMHELEVIQGLSRGLARSIALDTQLAGDEGRRPDAVRHLFDQLMSVNPSVEVYLLDNDGRIVGDAAPAGHLKRDRVALAPIQRLLAGDALPIVGDDPRSVDGRKVFSAAALHTHGRADGYIYVVLLGEEHDRLAAKIGASTVLRTTLWSMALVALFGLLAGLFAFRRITRPLRRLTGTMQHFDTRADVAPPPAPAAAAANERDEIAILDVAFSQMAGRIGEQWQELKQLDLDRRELVANISHDLRTPLASLHGYLETLLQKDATLDAAQRQRYLGMALGQSRKVATLAQSLFELAKLEHGLVEPAMEDFSLSDLLQDVFQKFELQAQAGNVALRADVGHGALLVNADLGMIERVLTNLIDNAIRHTPAGGSVDVTLAPGDGVVTVTVSDTGPGMPPALLADLFRRPFALTGPRSDGGLGLLIAHRILRLHHRDIALVDAAGRGATFRFALAASAR